MEMHACFVSNTTHPVPHLFEREGDRYEAGGRVYLEGATMIQRLKAERHDLISLNTNTQTSNNVDVLGCREGD